MFYDRDLRTLSESQTWFNLIANINVYTRVKVDTNGIDTSTQTSWLNTPSSRFTMSLRKLLLLSVLINNSVFKKTIDETAFFIVF